MQKLEQIYEGKAKKVYATDDPNLVIVDYKDDATALDGLDALLATVQMPSGIPVATVAINGAKNAAVLAAQILAVSDDSLAAKLDAQRADMAKQIAEKEQKLQSELAE